MIESSRRGFLSGLVSLIAAPAIVRVASIMPVKSMPIDPIEFVHQQIAIGYKLTHEAIIDNLLYRRYTDMESGLSEWFREAI